MIKASATPKVTLTKIWKNLKVLIHCWCKIVQPTRDHDSLDQQKAKQEPTKRH